jgi:lysophospholipase L1-like esterase
MMVRSRPLLYGAALVLVLAALPAGRPGAGAGAAAGPKAYYLALGDSLAFGYQPDLNFSQGYANDFYRYLQPRGTSHLINMGCPGATTASFINGRCLLAKYSYTGSQLSAALSFIRQHAGQVSPVTLDIGANDVLPLLNTSTCTVATNYPTVLSTFAANFSMILSQLRTALNGTGDLFVMNYYDPFQNQCQSNPQVLSLLQTFNQHIALDAASFAVPVAPVFAAFGGATTPNPNICADTWMCSTPPDIHATQEGYADIAMAFVSIAGY